TTWPDSSTLRPTWRRKASYPEPSLAMSTDEPSAPRPRFPRPSPLVLRFVLILVAIAGMGAAFALTFLPTAKGLGVMAQRFEQKVGCQGKQDIQFPRFPERSTIFASDGKTVLAHIYLDENRKIVRL